MLSLGIDIGSLSTDAVLLNDKGDILASAVIATGASSKRAAETVYQRILEDYGINKGDIGVIIATGYGRIKVPFANDVVTEITCHAKGAYYYFSKARTLIDIGGQDSKAIKIDVNGNVADFVMNDKCAAGTGRFLEVMARALEIDLEDMGELSLKGTEEVSISSLCTVFAESEVVSLIGADHRVEDICRSLHSSIAKRIVAQVKRIGVEDDVIMSGGVAKNIGVVHELEKNLRRKIYISPDPQIVGALGAALIGLEKAGLKKASIIIVKDQKPDYLIDEAADSQSCLKPVINRLEPSVNNFDLEDSSLPKIGYFCSYIPVEIIRAAGFHPIRIRGIEGDAASADKVLCGNICPYIKSVVDQKLSGKLDDLKGVIFTNSCDGMRRLYDTWVSLDRGERFNYILDLPKNNSEHSINYFAILLRGFKEGLERYFNISFSLDDINLSISTYNKVRERVTLFIQKQWSGYIGHSGYEIFSLIKRGINAVPEKFSEYLTFIMKQKDHVFDMRRVPRLLLWGGIIENERLVKVIEDAGARVVADDLCSGSRYYNTEVNITNNPFLALAERYLKRIPCSRMLNITERINNVIKIIKENAISGSIYHSLKFCDHSLYDLSLIKKVFQRENIPLLALSCDYNSSNEGQIRTRVEAFIEQLNVQTQLNK